MNQPAPIHVLESIWERSTGRYVFLPTMTEDGTWHEGKAELPNYIFGKSNPGFTNYLNHYFTPLKYKTPSRNKSALASPGVIFADIDGPKPDFRLEPSVLIQSSEGHYHGYWFLKTPVPVADWEPAAKGWSQEISADPGGWDTTQVLRVPGTLNHKEGNGLFKVRTISFNPHLDYALGEFPNTPVYTGEESHMPPVDKMLAIATLNEVLTNETLLTARYWLTVTKEELKALGTIDRSAIMWQLERSLLEYGFTDVEVFNVLYFSAVNKFEARPEILWREVVKAASDL